jgi:prepilin-type N-terminal cleavage/methylation domain-containing protein/prepilin-type processing-associated H-X9-DG protein
MRSEQKLNRQTAFTLMEVLVVVAIISILSALLFPVFTRAKLKSKSTVSVSNLKQLYLATQVYGADYDDKMVFGLPLVEAKFLSVPDDLYEIAKTAPIVEENLEPYGLSPELLHAPGDSIDYPFYGTSYAIRRRSTLLALPLTCYDRLSDEPMSFEVGIYYDDDSFVGRWPSYNVLYFDGSVRWTKHNEFFAKLPLPE